MKCKNSSGKEERFLEKHRGTLLLTRSELADLMTMDDYIRGIEDTFRMHGEGSTYGTDMIHGDTPSDIEFHIKAGGLKLGNSLYYGLKINASSFSNMERFGLPNIMGAILLFDAEKGIPLAIVDSIDPTIKRTGAGTAVAAKYLARDNSETLTICGCGNQGRIQLTFVKEMLPVNHVFAFDQNERVSTEYAERMGQELSIRVEATRDLARAVGQSDIVVTCTPSKRPFLRKEFIRPGTFVAAIGADSPDKWELEPTLLQGTKVVVDILEQCAIAGELHHALEMGIIAKEDVHGEIGQIVAGKKPGRESDDEIIVYDSTGTALQDTAAAVICYEKALSSQKGRYISFFD